MSYDFGPNTGQWNFGVGGYNEKAIIPELAASVGYDANAINNSYNTARFAPSYDKENFDGGAGQIGGDFNSILASKGLRLARRSADGRVYQQLFDASNNPWGQQYNYTPDPENAFGLGVLGMAGFGAAAALGAGGAAAGASNGSWDVAGAGAGGGAPAVAGGSAAAAPAVAGGGGVGGGVSTAGGLLGSGGGILGTGLSGSNVASLIGAGAGLLGSGKGGLNSASQDVQNKLDPRIAQYLYGDGSGGLLGNVAKLYNEQMATGGLNPLQQQGIAAQQAVLQNPNYARGFDAMKNTGVGLLNAPQAGNPFTSGQMQLQGPQSLLQQGRMTIQRPGLLGSQ